MSQIQELEANKPAKKIPYALHALKKPISKKRIFNSDMSLNKLLDSGLSKHKITS